jgi:hypothetical protein
MSSLPPATVPAAAKPKAFEKGGTGWAIAGIIADAIASGFGAKPGFGPAYLAGQEDNRTLELWREKIAQERADRMQPRLMQAGGRVLSVDPRSNAVTPIYEAPPEAPDPTSLERNIAFYQRINPNASPAEIAELARQGIAAPQFPRIVTYSRGDQTITEQVNPDGTRTPVASAPRTSGSNVPPAGFRWSKSGDLEFIPGGPADPKNRNRTPNEGRVLPAGEIEKLSDQAETVAQITSLIGGFKDNFSGPGSGWESFGQRILGDRVGTPGQAEWWQQMEAYDNVIRNKLFGSALTATEQAAWKRTTVTPNMDPGKIKTNLRQREAILKRAMSRKERLFKEGGYNVPSLTGESPASSNGAKFLGFE